MLTLIYLCDYIVWNISRSWHFQVGGSYDFGTIVHHAGFSMLTHTYHENDAQTYTGASFISYLCDFLNWSDLLLFPACLGNSIYRAFYMAGVNNLIFGFTFNISAYDIGASLFIFTLKTL